MNTNSNTLAVSPVPAPTGAALSSAGKSDPRSNNNQRKSDDIKPYIEPLQIGDRCQVLWRDGTTHLLAKVIERKRNPKQKELVKTTMPPVVAPSSSRTASDAGGGSGDAAAVVVAGDGEGEKNKNGKGTGKGKLKLLGKGSATATSTSTATVPAESTIDDGSEEPASKRSKLATDGVDDLDDVGLKAIAAGGEVNTDAAPLNAFQAASQAGQLKSPPVLKQPIEKNEQRPQKQQLSAWDLLYYVHYEEHDRRLDEWVPLSRFDVSTLHRIPPPEEEHDIMIGDAGGMDDWRRSTRRASDGKFSRSNASSRRSRNSSNASSSALSDIKGRGGNNNDNNGGIDSSHQNNSNSSDALLRKGGNWHGNSGNPDLAELEAEHHEITKVKNVAQIVMGKYLVEAWYYSPFPPPYDRADTLYICEFTLKYMRKPRFFLKHCAECPHKSPPGDEIYREGRLSVYELDGKDHRVYCQNLCLLAKLFLDHKTLYYDVDPFYFYVITEVDDEGAHIVGYFSKEKVSAEDYNLACILTFPQYQKCGYGKFIISLSYELSKREGKPGSPEKTAERPREDIVSQLLDARVADVIQFADGEENVQIKDISLMTGIKTEDIISTLQSLNMIRFWKGQHVVFVMQDFLKKYMAQKKKIRLCDPKCLTWIPHAERKKGGSSASD